MVYPSGKVETSWSNCPSTRWKGSSGWFIHQGKLKPWKVARFCGANPDRFRMVYPSGEVETRRLATCSRWKFTFRMVYPSGEVETCYDCDLNPLESNQFRMVYPSGEVETGRASAGRRPGWTSFRMVYPSGEVETTCRPPGDQRRSVPDGLSIRGS